MTAADPRAATARLLWAACHPVPQRDAVAAAIADGADIERAALTAVAQRVGPLLYGALETAGVRPLGPAAELLRREAELRRAQAVLLLPLAVKHAVEPLTGAGIEPLIFKGPTLAARYPSPALRPMDDIDVIVPQREHAAATAALRAYGWSVEERPGFHADTYLRHPRIPDFPLELHRDLSTWRERANHLRGDDLWRARVPVECFGVPAFRLPPELDLVALAAHAGKPFHHFHRLVWSVDVAVLLQSEPDLDWDRVRRIADNTGSRTTLAIGLIHARRLGAGSPEDLRRIGASRTRRAALAPLLQESWPLVECNDQLKRVLRFALSDSVARTAGLFLATTLDEGALKAPARAWRLARMAVRRALRLRDGGAG